MLALGFRLQIALCRTHKPDRLAIENQFRLLAVDQRAEPEFRVPRCADLAHDQDVERRADANRDLIGNRHAAARQRHQQRIDQRLARDRLSELPSGIRPVFEEPCSRKHLISPRFPPPPRVGSPSSGRGGTWPADAK
ncbi:hypothetical protein D9M70_554010 [compost metagenome]